MKQLNADGSEQDPQREAWMLGFEDLHDGRLACVLCGALVMKSATYASRHRTWHVNHDGK